jgi:hypothetical protein
LKETNEISKSNSRAEILVNVRFRKKQLANGRNQSQFVRQTAEPYEMEPLQSPVAEETDSVMEKQQIEDKDVDSQSVQPTIKHGLLKVKEDPRVQKIMYNEVNNMSFGVS